MLLWKAAANPPSSVSWVWLKLEASSPAEESRQDFSDKLSLKPDESPTEQSNLIQSFHTSSLLEL